MTIMSSPNRKSSHRPSNDLPIVEPRPAPTIPQAANTSAQGQRTLPARARVIRLDKALSATATALVPMATCVDGTPTP